MTKRKPPPTLAEVVRDLAAAPDRPRNRRTAIRPGTFNLEGELFAPDGTPLVCSDEALCPGEALAELRNGALLAFEGCGCGGGGGCAPDWLDPRQRRDLCLAGQPRLTYDCWIELWTGGTHRVVFAHGPIRWGPHLD